MKIGILLIVFMSFFYIANGQVQTKSFYKGDAFKQVKFISEQTKANKAIKLATFDTQKLIEEDKLNVGMARPFRFGKGFDVNISLADGEWTDVENGRLWSMEFQSPNAYSINFVFDQFFLSENAELYVVNSDGTMLYGPVTSKQNTKNGFFLTDLISGDDVTIYLNEPNSEKEKSKLTIKRIVHAYKNSRPDSYGNFNGSYSCNNDINCYADWDDESDALALVLLSNGTEWCSGALIMAANQSFRPYFLSAFHCIDTTNDENLTETEISNAQNWMFKFQYKKATCGGSTATTGVTYNGATFRAAWNSSDFSLMELTNSPLGDTQFSWLGWDRSGNTPTSGTGIHHPVGDVMKISFDNDQLNPNSTQISWMGGPISPINTHWVVGFDNGTAQGGSSGSPLFDQNSRVIGQLHGGQNGCAPVTKYYGRFNNSWTGGGTNTTRLSNWLDPCASGAMTTNTSRSPYLSGPSVICSSGATYTVNNVPAGATVTWNKSSNLNFDNQPGNPKTFTASGPNGSGWVQATIVNTACGNVTLPTKTVWVDIPPTPEINSYTPFVWSTSYWPTPVKVYTVYTGQEIDFYDENSNTFGGLIESFYREWNIDAGSISYEAYDYGPGGRMYFFHQPGSVRIRAKLSNSCGETEWSEPVFVDVIAQEYLLSLSPNPASDEVIVELKGGNKTDRLSNEYGWDLDVYDAMQSLKTKIQRIKGNKQTLNTSGWKEGVYIIRAKVGKKLVTGKLVVKH